MPDELSAEDKALEAQLKGNVMKMAAQIPLDEPVATLAIALIATMGQRRDTEKVMLIATTLVTALKMIRERKEQETPSDDPPG